MSTIISLPLLKSVPESHARMDYSTTDLVLAMYEVLYPGCIGESMPAPLTQIALIYVRDCVVITQVLISLGANNLARSLIQEIKPGVVQVNAKECIHDRMAC